MSSFTNKINRGGRYAQQLASYGVSNDMKDFGDFKRNIFSSLNETSSGQGALSFMGEDELVELFKQPNVKEQLERNIGKNKSDEIYGIANRTDFVVTREKPIGQKVTQRQVHVFVADKNVKISSHTRSGRRITPYSRGFSKWSPAQTRFIKVRKAKKISPKQIAYEYNKQFQENPRSKSSISTKVYRI